jgi:putative oxidoreductase
MYSLWAPFLLRIVLGLIFIDLGRLALGKEKFRWIASLEALHIPSPRNVATLLGLIEIVGGLMLVVGIYTQIAALAFVVLTAMELYAEWENSDLLKRNLTFYLLLFVIALSLLITGAGMFAFDIPL